MPSQIARQNARARLEGGVAGANRKRDQFGRAAQPPKVLGGVHQQRGGLVGEFGALRQRQEAQNAVRRVLRRIEAVTVVTGGNVQKAHNLARAPGANAQMVLPAHLEVGGWR